MSNFYKNILGFSIKEQDDNHVIFNVGANGHTLTLQYLEDGRRPGFREARFISCRLFTSYTHRFSKLLFHASRLNVPVGGGDHLVSERYTLMIQKVTALKYIKIVHLKIGNGMVIL